MTGNNYSWHLHGRPRPSAFTSAWCSTLKSFTLPLKTCFKAPFCQFPSLNEFQGCFFNSILLQLLIEEGKSPWNLFFQLPEITSKAQLDNHLTAASASATHVPLSPLPMPCKQLYRGVIGVMVSSKSCIFSSSLCACVQPGTREMAASGNVGSGFFSVEVQGKRGVVLTLVPELWSIKLDPNFFESLARAGDFGSRLSLVLDLMSSGGRAADSALRKQWASPHHLLWPCTMYIIVSHRRNLGLRRP